MSCEWMLSSQVLVSACSLLRVDLEPPVCPSGSAHIQLFEGKPVNFSNVHIPGVLVYWHLDKCLCIDNKLEPTAGVGVYIGPADTVCQS
jgi:hypothetical protein